MFIATFPGKGKGKIMFHTVLVFLFLVNKDKDYVLLLSSPHRLLISYKIAV
jgi:hypothetical protein